MLLLDHRIGQQDRSTDRAAQVAHIAGPVILQKPCDRLLRQALDRLAELTVCEIDETLGQEQDVLRVLPQWWDADDELAEAKEEILTERAPRRGSLQILVGGRDHSALDLHGRGRADAAHVALLERTQQLGLRAQRHVADLVEK